MPYQKPALILIILLSLACGAAPTVAPDARPTRTRLPTLTPTTQTQIQNAQPEPQNPAPETPTPVPPSPTPIPPSATPVPPTATPQPTATPIPPTPVPPTSTPVPTQTPTPPPPTPTPYPGCDCSRDAYNCTGDKAIPNPQACYEYCLDQGRGDVHDLDRDDDGLACENE